MIKKYYVMEENGILFPKPKIFDDTEESQINRESFTKLSYYWKSVWLELYGHTNIFTASFISLLRAYTSKTDHKILCIVDDQKHEKITITKEITF